MPSKIFIIIRFPFMTLNLKISVWVLHQSVNFGVSVPNLVVRGGGGGDGEERKSLFFPRELNAQTVKRLTPI